MSTFGYFEKIKNVLTEFWNKYRLLLFLLIFVFNLYLFLKKWTWLNIILPIQKKLFR